LPWDLLQNSPFYYVARYRDTWHEHARLAQSLLPPQTQRSCEHLPADLALVPWARPAKHALFRVFDSRFCLLTWRASQQVCVFDVEIRVQTQDIWRWQLLPTAINAQSTLQIQSDLILSAVLIGHLAQLATAVTVEITCSRREAWTISDYASVSITEQWLFPARSIATGVEFRPVRGLSTVNSGHPSNVSQMREFLAVNYDIYLDRFKFQLILSSYGVCLPLPFNFAHYWQIFWVLEVQYWDICAENLKFIIPWSFDLCVLLCFIAQGWGSLELKASRTEASNCLGIFSKTLCSCCMTLRESVYWIVASKKQWKRKTWSLQLQSSPRR